MLSTMMVMAQQMVLMHHALKLLPLMSLQVEQCHPKRWYFQYYYHQHHHNQYHYCYYLWRVFQQRNFTWRLSSIIENAIQWLARWQVAVGAESKVVEVAVAVALVVYTAAQFGGVDNSYNFEDPRYKSSMDAFDVTDRNSWYFGPMSRQEATDLLMNEREIGVFLVRDSNSIAGDFVLCVREDTKVSNYIINKIHQDDQIFFRIGDQVFENLPKLLTFYTLHYLDTTPLRRPAPRKDEQVMGRFDFEGTDQDDLPFRRGEILTVVRKDEEQWWTAKNQQGQIGQIPVPYVQRCDGNADDNCIARFSGSDCGNELTSISSQRSPLLHSNVTICHQLSNSLKKSDLNRSLPAFARVKQARVPNAYDKTALKLEIGDVIKVIRTNINGQWEGELKGKTGHFPFTHVEFIGDMELVHTDEYNAIDTQSVPSGNIV